MKNPECEMWKNRLQQYPNFNLKFLYQINEIFVYLLAIELLLALQTQMRV